MQWSACHRLPPPISHPAGCAWQQQTRSTFCQCQPVPPPRPPTPTPPHTPHHTLPLTCAAVSTKPGATREPEQVPYALPRFHRTRLA